MTPRDQSEQERQRRLSSLYRRLLDDAVAAQGIMTAEEHAALRLATPGPYQDMVAAMYLDGAPLPLVAVKFGLQLREAAAIIEWVCEVNRRRCVP